MRLMGIILISGLMISSFAVDQQKAPQTKVAPSNKQEAVSTEKLMEGMVVSIDKAKQSFVVKLKGKDYEFIVDGATVITINGERKSFEELCAGAGIRVNYVKDSKGVRIAKSINQNVPLKKNKENKAQGAQKVEVKQAEPSNNNTATQKAVPENKPEIKSHEQQPSTPKQTTTQQQPVEQQKATNQTNAQQPAAEAAEKPKERTQPSATPTNNPVEQKSQPVQNNPVPATEKK